MGKLSDSTKNDLLRVAQMLADAARAAILPHFRSTSLSADNKLSNGDYDPVTVADKAGERVMREILGRERPDDAILGEEFGLSTGTSGLTWVLDPIDGTRGFITGTPTWGVLIAVGGENGPELGLIDQPYIGERFVGGFGHAWMRGPFGQQNICCRGAKTLGQATLFSTFPEIGSTQERAAFDALSSKVQLTRFGMDCYAYALLAAGHIDLVVEAGLHPHDIQAPIALIKAAGGIVTDWDGNTAHQGGRAIAAANADLHAQALALLSGVS